MPEEPTTPAAGPAALGGTDDVEAALRRVLDRHGFGFQYAVLKKIASLPADGPHVPHTWRIEDVESPVRHRGRTTHIDFVLRLVHGKRLLLVAECKRVNPGFAKWCFVRTPTRDGFRDSVVVAEWLRIDARRDMGNPQRTGVVGVPIWSNSERIYNLPFVLDSDRKAESGGNPREAIDHALAQAWRGLGGLFALYKEHPELLEMGELADTRALPVIFTTAELWTSDVDLAASDLENGKTPHGQATKVQWLWLKERISLDLKAELSSDTPLDRGLAGYAKGEYARCCAIVTSSGIEEFLRQAIWSALD